MPVVLVLFDASRRRAYWLDVERYFEEDPTRVPAKGVKTIRVRVPNRQVVNVRAIQRIRRYMQEVLDQSAEEVDNA